jgi:hypothetical protein
MINLLVMTKDSDVFNQVGSGHRGLYLKQYNFNADLIVNIVKCRPLP